ncbi:MAG: hypothetical protein WC900_05275 [Oscillospiraceae bacterium]|jgi:hypothetical protein
MKKQTRFYNVIFPIWFLIFIPVTWLVIIPANFLIDTVVLLISLIFVCRDTRSIKEIYKKSIIKICIIGFLCDAAGAGLLALSQFVLGDFLDGISAGAANAIAYNPFDNMLALAIIILAVIISAALIYFVNIRFSFNKTNLRNHEKKSLAIKLAIFTAPYTFLVPYSFFERLFAIN